MNGWSPRNDVEWALAAALSGGDRREFFRLLTVVPLLMPRAGTDILTVEIFERRYVPIFTSVDTLHERVGKLADGFAQVDYPWLRQALIGVGLRLAVNPDTPIEAYVSVESLELAARGELVVPTLAEFTTEVALLDAAPRTPVESALLAAVEAGDVDAYANALLDADVLVPTLDEVTDPARVLESDFPWRIGGTPSSPAIAVFTSPELLLAVLGEPGPAVTLPFVAVAGVWPDGHRLCVNPGTVFGIELAAEQVPLLLLWPSG
jgi:hypothetical protein